MELKCIAHLMLGLLALLAMYSAMRIVYGHFIAYDRNAAAAYFGERGIATTSSQITPHWENLPFKTGDLFIFQNDKPSEKMTCSLTGCNVPHINLVVKDEATGRVGLITFNLVLPNAKKRQTTIAQAKNVSAAFAVFPLDLVLRRHAEQQPRGLHWNNALYFSLDTKNSGTPIAAADVWRVIQDTNHWKVRKTTYIEYILGPLRFLASLLPSGVHEYNCYTAQLEILTRLGVLDPRVQTESTSVLACEFVDRQFWKRTTPSYTYADPIQITIP